ncbi:protein Tob1 [Planococcus citri]|uniref:protein Tob1 n=1 Tax=Planococcus citri TaxID=170843 RepID=UPI0031F8B882
MHMEIHVAINYVMSQLYEKLPRRRVNIFGEELEKALKEKFEGHWYPDAPEKGSGYRCLKVGRAIDPPDPLLEKAAYDSGLDVQDILEHLPKELNIWIDPGEVSFRIGDKGPTEILYSTEIAENSDNEVARTFNPEAKCFRPNDFTAPFNPLIIAKPASPASGSLSPVNGIKCCSPPSAMPMKIPNYNNKNAKAITPNNMHVFNQRTSTPTFTTATFAQTKFGSTKLKTNSKRTNRMSPTEFANYIKQRAQMQQQMQMQQHTQQQNTPAISPPMRSFGENFYSPQNNFVFRNGGMDSSFSMDSLNRFSSFADDGTSQFFNQSNVGPLSPVSTTQTKGSSDKHFAESFNFSLNSPGPSSPYQHLLLAN